MIDVSQTIKCDCFIPIINIMLSKYIKKEPGISPGSFILLF